MRIFAHTLSILFHPILIPTLTIFLLVRLDPLHSQMIPMKDLWNILLAVGITTGILPALSIFILSRSDLIESVQLKKRKERILPFIITLFYLGATYFLLLKPDLPSLLYSALLGGIVAFLGLTIMTTVWRVSVHLCAYAGMVGALLGLFVHAHFPIRDLLVLAVLVGGLLASARVQLGAHSLSELALGTVWGFFCSFFFVSHNLYIDASLFG